MITRSSSGTHGRDARHLQLTYPRKALRLKEEVPPLCQTTQLPSNPDVLLLVPVNLLSLVTMELLPSETTEATMNLARHLKIQKSGLKLWLSVLTSLCSLSDLMTTISTSTTPVTGLSKASIASTLRTSWPLTGPGMARGSEPTAELTNCFSPRPIPASKTHLAGPTLPRSFGQPLP